MTITNNWDGWIGELAKTRRVIAPDFIGQASKCRATAGRRTPPEIPPTKTSPTRRPPCSIISRSRERDARRVFFASGDWTCSVARMRGTMKGSMRLADGTEIPPTGKSFDVDFYTVAKWHEGQIVEENLMYDLVTFLKQIGLSD